MWKRATISVAGIVASVPSPQAASRYASSACSTAKRSGTTGPAGRPPIPSSRGGGPGAAGRGGLASGLAPTAGTARAQRPCNLPAQFVRLERDRAAVLAQDPRGEQRQGREIRHEDAVVELARVAERALDPPGGVACKLDARLTRDVADLPRRPA